MRLDLPWLSSMSSFFYQTMTLHTFLVRRLCVFAGIQLVVARRGTPNNYRKSNLHAREDFVLLGRFSGEDGEGWTIDDDSPPSWDTWRERSNLRTSSAISWDWEQRHNALNSGLALVEEDESLSSSSLEDVQLTGRLAMPRPRSSTLVVDAPPQEEESTTLQLCLPLIPKPAWESMTGTEFEDNPLAMQQLTRSGLLMMRDEGNDWIEWTPTRDTKAALESPQSKRAALEEGKILVYMGTCKQEDCVGGDLPLIKTESILPLSAQEMAELLMDSTKVPIYNKLSLGRTDMKQIDEQTKIVRNLTQPPMSSSSMVSVTLLHARPLQEEDSPVLAPTADSSSLARRIDGGYVCVSRAVPAAAPEGDDKLVRNDILMGVNLLQEISPTECYMTAVTHVYSPSIPKLLAPKLGVSSAINFVKDIRKACVPVGAD